MQFTFILVKPAVPENVGAAARAIKTMGFNDFRLVNPCDYKCVKAQMLAHGSHDILEGAKVFNSLSEALADIDFSVATSAKQRWVKKDVVMSHDLKSFLAKKKDTVKSVAIVFGGEESGLSNSDMALCDMVAAIPLPQPYPSLNLAQAVMVFAYALMNFEVAEPENPAAGQENEGYKPLKNRVVKILNSIGITSSSLIYGRILERFSQITDDDVNLLHSISAAISKKLEEKSDDGLMS